MIGGYIFHHEIKDISDRLNDTFNDTYKTIPCGQNGFLFFDNPFSDFPTGLCFSTNLVILSQDLLVARNSCGDYSLIDVNNDLSGSFLNKRADTFKDIISDFRLIVLERRGENIDLYLVSNRAGNGRMYYSIVESGILFSSDLRFLLKIVPLDVNDTAVYSILKYGAIPEPITISVNIAAVPPAHYLLYNVLGGTYQSTAFFRFEFPCDTQRETVDDFDAVIQPVKETLRKSAHFLGQLKPAILISGGVDSSLYASYLNEFDSDRLHGINCTFGDEDPELKFARMFAQKINANLHVGKMHSEDALAILNDTVALTDHPFADFSSLPISFILKFMKENVRQTGMLIEGNGGDDCFGFPALADQLKTQVKGYFPRICKDVVALVFRDSKSWKWESKQGFLSRILALADDHEINPLNYFLVFAPTNFLRLNGHQARDRNLNDVMESVFSSCTESYDSLSYEAKVTVRQLLHINSRQWTAKAFSVGESLGIRTIYPYIWRDILILQGSIPWDVKINKDTVKWPLKRLLEEFMPADFVYRKKSGFVPPFVQWLTARDFNHAVRETLLSPNGIVNRLVPSNIISELLADALQGQRLRYPVLNFLWAALFTELWISHHKITRMS